MDSYYVERQVGAGCFGRVYKGRKKMTGQVVALKFIPKKGISEKELRSLKKEMEILRGLQHPNIVKLYDSFETEEKVVIVTEYAEGQLFAVLQEVGLLPESRVREIACQLVSALHYLHSHRIIHRDMKPQNVLLGESGVVKLCDFGFARSMSASTLVLTSIKGTPLYMSPELVAEKPYDHSADLWSLGCILYELHQGEPPFYTNSIGQLVKMIVEEAVQWPDSMSDTCKSFLKGLLTKDPEQRLSWPDLLHHPFVAGGVLVASDESVPNPLAVALPSPDTPTPKRLQASEKTAAASGVSRLLRKVREQSDNRKEKPQRRDGAKVRRETKSMLEQIKKDDVGKEIVKSAMAAAAATPRAKPPSSDVFAASRPTAMKASNESLKPKDPPPFKSKLRSQIGEDSGRDLQGYSEDSLMIPQGADSEDECEELSSSSTTEQFYSGIIAELKSDLLAFRTQLADGDITEVQWIHKPLKVLRSLIQTSDFEKSRLVGRRLGLPRVFFDLISVAVESSNFTKQAWSVSALGEMIAVLSVYSVKHPDWAIEEQRLEEFTKPFIAILSQPGLVSLAPSAASVLSLMIQHDVDVEIDMDLLTALLKDLLSDSHELQQPPVPGWGLFDGFLSLLLHGLEEYENGRGASCLDSVMSALWKKVGASVAKRNPDGNFLSANGLRSFLCAVQFVFAEDPYSCAPLFSEPTSTCVDTLCWLLGTDCLRPSAAAGPGRPEEDAGLHSVNLLSCQLLCFPFALDLPSDAACAILELYDGCGVVASLLQAIQSLPTPLLELPLSLLSCLLLLDPNRWFPPLGEALPCFFAPQTKSRQIRQIRTASSLLLELLRQRALWDSAERLLIALSQVTLCCSHHQLHLEASVLHQALSHPHGQIKAATCRLLGNLNPFSPPLHPTLQPDTFQKLIDCLHDSSLPVRRTAIRAVGNWLGHLAALTMRASDGKGGGTPRGGAFGSTAEQRLENEERCGWLEEARTAVPKLVPLITDPDALTRRHCCETLANLINVDGAVSTLLEKGAFGLLLRAACTDFHHAVRQAAIATLCLYSREDPVRQVLISSDALERLLKASQCGPPQCDYHRLMAALPAQFSSGGTTAEFDVISN
ncbi:serine/threonine-protein kinase 36 [Brachionichthys hirsutus]|uniref:serine/threonine-protein kinase 36 n=1 Tax=Brachionichthys hirsutus TaxID=412623 RepID=UPI0036052845